MLEKFDNKDNLLDLARLTPGLEVKATCFCSGVKAKTDVNGDPYLVFNMLDCNGIMIQGRMFKVRNISKELDRAALVRHSVMQFTGSVSLWNNNINLLVESYAYGDQDLRKQFRQRVADLDELKEELLTRFAERGKKDYLSSVMVSADLASLCNSEVGGYLRYIDLMFKRIEAMKRLPYIALDELHEVFILVVPRLFEYLQTKEKLDVIPLSDKLELLQSIQCEVSGSNVANKNIGRIAVELLAGLIELENPTHVYAQIILDLHKSVMFELRLIYNIPMLAAASSMEGGNALSVFY